MSKLEGQQIKYHDDMQMQFNPLLLFLQKLDLGREKTDDVMRHYMYMGHCQVSSHQTSYYYKHDCTRDYLYVDEDGSIIDGVVDIRTWN